MLNHDAVIFFIFVQYYCLLEVSLLYYHWMNYGKMFCCFKKKKKTCPSYINCMPCDKSLIFKLWFSFVPKLISWLKCMMNYMSLLTSSHCLPHLGRTSLIRWSLTVMSWLNGWTHHVLQCLEKTRECDSMSGLQLSSSHRLLLTIILLPLLTTAGHTSLFLSCMDTTAQIKLQLPVTVKLQLSVITLHKFIGHVSMHHLAAT